MRSSPILTRHISGTSFSSTFSSIPSPRLPRSPPWTSKTIKVRRGKGDHFHTRPLKVFTLSWTDPPTRLAGFQTLLMLNCVLKLQILLQFLNESLSLNISSEDLTTLLDSNNPIVNSWLLSLTNMPCQPFVEEYMDEYRDDERSGP